jgi:hypothetical protein
VACALEFQNMLARVVNSNFNSKNYVAKVQTGPRLLCMCFCDTYRVIADRPGDAKKSLSWGTADWTQSLGFGLSAITLYMCFA